MNFFKEYYSECQIVPPLPTGYGCIKSAQNGSETVHPCISALNYKPFLIHHFIKEVLFRRLSISGIRADIGNNPIFVKSLSKRPGVKAGIGIIEYTIKRNPTSVQLKSYAVHILLYLIKISMITFLRFGHRQRQSLSICKINRIGCITFLPSLIFNAFTTSYCRSMGAVNVRQRQINKMAVFTYQPEKHLFPVSELTPFPVMVEYGLVTWYLYLKEMTYRQMLPLTTGLEAMTIDKR